MRSRGKISLSLLQVFCGVRFCLVSMLMVWRRPNAFLSPMEHEAKRKFCATRVKGGNPLRVQGRSPRILAVRQSRRQAHSEPNQASQTACALAARRLLPLYSCRLHAYFPRSLHICRRVRCFFFFPGFRVAASGGAKMPILAQILFFAKNSAFFGTFVRGRGETTAQMRQKNVGKHSGAGRGWKGANPNRNRQKAFIRQK